MLPYFKMLLKVFGSGVPQALWSQIPGLHSRAILVIYPIPDAHIQWFAFGGPGHTFVKHDNEAALVHARDKLPFNV